MLYKSIVTAVFQTSESGLSAAMSEYCSAKAQGRMLDVNAHLSTSLRIRYVYTHYRTQHGVQLDSFDCIRLDCNVQ